MKILMVVNDDLGLYKFRGELIDELLKKHTVHICLPNGECVENLIARGCIYHNCEFNRRGTNPIAELKLFSFYKALLKKVKPDIVLTYTVKPNIYAGMACASLNIPYIANITGLGVAIENGGLMQKLMLFLYKCGLRKAQKVFFQNESNQNFMLAKGVVKGDYALLPGSGVNLQEHKPEPYPEQEEPLIFVTVGRVMKNKGADEIIYTAKTIRKDYPNAIFRMIGIFDGAYEEKIKAAVDTGDIEYLGLQPNVHNWIKEAHAIIHASYHEGMSNVLLEAAACGRPVIATDVAGCRETYENGVSGFACEARNRDDLVRAVREFIETPYAQKVAMGKAGRQKIEREFDRNIVINKYVEEINKIK